MAYDQCVVKFLVVCLIGFIVMLIANIVGPFEGRTFKFISVVILSCIVLMVCAYLCERACQACRKYRRSRSRANVQDRRASSAPDEELLNIFPELRRLSYHSNDASVTEDPTPQPEVVEEQPSLTNSRQTAARSLSIVTEEDEEVEVESLVTRPAGPDDQQLDDDTELCSNTVTSLGSCTASFESVDIEFELPPPYDSNLPLYNDVVVPATRFESRSTL